MILRVLLAAGILFDIHHHVNLSEQHLLYAVGMIGSAIIIDILTGRN